MIRAASLMCLCIVTAWNATATDNPVRGGPYVDRSPPAVAPPTPVKSMLDLPLPPPPPVGGGAKSGVGSTTGLDPAKLHVIGITARGALLRYERDASGNNDNAGGNRGGNNDGGSSQLRVYRGVTVLARQNALVFLEGQSYLVNVDDDTVNLYIVQGKRRELAWSGQIEGQPYTEPGPSTHTFTPPLSAGADFSKNVSTGSGLGSAPAAGNGSAPGATAPGNANGRQ
ncbi:hypothetical protein E4K72_03525 [Oxalobacteraceae bacterium OM1]|nr:hypothetical protein E4K72_03525 [Oxalobacteraceae bacterium OM1]